ncbi:MAG TPA: hypothetical protein PLH83_06840 [Ruminococcus sp.]|mgnify:FL=1|nr:hypothetical protein [Ruminococcus sp.]
MSLNKLRDSLMKNNFSLALLAILLAILVWFIISMTQYPSVQKTIANIPLSTDITDSVAESNGLSVISCNVEEVTVELLGSRTTVGNLNNENLVAYIDADSVSSTGTKNLAIKIRSTNGVNFEVKNIYPSSATVVFDKMDTKEFPVLAKIPNVTVVEGKAINSDDVTCEPDVVRITGPSAQLDKIAKVYAVSNKTNSLDTSYVLPSDEVQLYTEDGSIIEQSSLLKLSTANFSINIPVRTQKTVPLTVGITNAPSTFDQSCIKFNLSADSVVLATNNSSTELPQNLEIGKVALSDLTPDFTKTFSLSNVLGENGELINMSDLETVTVSIDSEGLSTMDLTLDKGRITTSNIPDSSYTYNVMTSKLPITVVGPKDVIGDITAEDIVGDVNLLNAEITTDQITLPVTFSCLKHDNVWVVTNARVTIERTKSESTTTSPAPSN